MDTSEIAKLRGLIDTAVKAGADVDMLLPDEMKYRILNTSQSAIALKDPYLDEFLSTKEALELGKQRESSFLAYLNMKYGDEFNKSKEGMMLQEKFNNLYAEYKKNREKNAKIDTEELHELKSEMSQLKDTLAQLNNIILNSAQQQIQSTPVAIGQIQPVQVPVNQISGNIPQSNGNITNSVPILTTSEA